MKRSLLILALWAAASPALAEIRLGLVGGLSLSHLPFSPDEQFTTSETTTGFAGGAVVDVALGKRFALSFQPMFVRKGGRFRIEGDFNPEDLVFTDRVDYLELPALLEARFGHGRLRPYLLAGPIAGYRLSARTALMGETMDAKDNYKPWDFGVSAGAGLAFPAGTASGFLEARYGFGLVDVGKRTGTSIKNRGLLVLAGFSFGVGGH